MSNAVLVCVRNISYKTANDVKRGNDGEGQLLLAMLSSFLDSGGRMTSGIALSPKMVILHLLPAYTIDVSCLLQKFFELWNEEYWDGIKTRGDKIGMTLYIIMLLMT